MKTIYDAHTHIPFLLKVPGGIKGKVVNDVVSMLDMVPTVLDLAGVEPEDELPGEVLTSVIRGDQAPLRKNALVEIDRKTADHDLIQMRTLVTNEYKLVHYANKNELMLFDRTLDPHELKNLANEASMVGIVLEMMIKLSAELARTEMPLNNLQSRIRQEYGSLKIE